MPQSIGAVIRRLRRERGITQQSIEEKTEGKLDRDWLASIETGRSKSVRDPAKIQLLAELLGTTVADIYREAGIIEFPPRLNYRSALEERILDEIQKLPPELQEALYQMIVRIRKQDARIVPNESDLTQDEQDDDAKTHAA